MRLLLAVVLINSLIWTSLSVTGPVSSILYAQSAQIFPEVPAAHGQWATIRSGHILVQMVDGRVLDWFPEDGSWRLWNYDPGHTGDVLPDPAVAQGQWRTIRSGHTLIPMRDGRVLDWVAADGSWRLWNYDPRHTGDVLPDPAVAQGQWRTIRSGHTLIPMRDGRVLDWVAADGSWRLWNYDPGSTEDILPDPMVARGQWVTISSGQTLIPMGDGHMLDWVPNDGTWKLWEYTP